jgi:hypothetical protein
MTQCRSRTRHRRAYIAFRIPPGLVNRLRARSGMIEVAAGRDLFLVPPEEDGEVRDGDGPPRPGR